MKTSPSAGFTLIELLIVIAVIAILAAIALPNFSCAQVRSKTSRTKTDIRSLAVALESYNVDKTAYPVCWEGLPAGEERTARMGDGAHATHPSQHSVQDLYYLSFRALAPLTTPVAYLTSVPRDPHSVSGSAFTYVSFAPLGPMDRAERSWLIAGMAPDNVVGQWRTFPTGWLPPRTDPIIYDVTNGCMSEGDIVRTNNVEWYPKFHGLYQ